MELYMVVLGGKPDGRHTEQHDVFFGVGDSLKDLASQMEVFWPELSGKMHIDSWRKVSKVGTYHIEVIPKNEQVQNAIEKLYFVNLGGYKPEDMEEYHYKQLVVAHSIEEATEMATTSTFWQHHDLSHIDDKYGIDVDDIYDVEDLLSEEFRTHYALKIGVAKESAREDALQIGYLSFSELYA